MPVRVLGRCGGYDSDIADAITWASGGSCRGVPANANPAEVISLSLGGAAPAAHHAGGDQRRGQPRHHHRRGGGQREQQRLDLVAGQLRAT
jgi:hypothetical protein